MGGWWIMTFAELARLEERLTISNLRAKTFMNALVIWEIMVSYIHRNKGIQALHMDNVCPSLL